MFDPPTLLLVDGYPDEREMYAQYLQFNGFRVVVCPDPDAAVNAVKGHGAAAVVTRIECARGADGIELTRRLKADPRTRHVPVVVMTTGIERHVKQLAVTAGCDAFLLLPCDPRELLSQLRHLLATP